MAKLATSRSAVLEPSIDTSVLSPPSDVRRRVLSAGILFGVIASLIYFSWWLDPLRRQNPWLIAGLIAALGYTVAQIYAAWHLYLRVESPAPAVIRPGLRVDVFVTVFDEPLDLVERGLRAAASIRYPHRTYLLDDGPSPRFAALAARLGVGYLTRPGKDGAKAGNINAALVQTDGDFVTVFDVDHVPTADFLDVVLGYFDDPAVGFVQSRVGFHNQDESLVARAAAEQAYDPYGPTSMGMHGCGAAQVWGSHCTFRRSALAAIGGHQIGLAEDLHTSLRLHAAGWESVFVPKLSARGAVPADLMGITKQHFKWARGVFELLLAVYPRLWRRLSWSQNAAYVVRLTYYLIGPIFLLHALAAGRVLLQAGHGASEEFSSYLLHLAPLALSVVMVRQIAMRLWHLDIDARGLTWRGYALSCALWPVYTLALVCALLRFPIAHIVTPKERSGGWELPVAVPQILLICILLTGMAVRLLHGWIAADVPVMLFAVLLMAIQSTAIYAAVRE